MLSPRPPWAGDLISSTSESLFLLLSSPLLCHQLSFPTFSFTLSRNHPWILPFSQHRQQSLSHRSYLTPVLHVQLDPTQFRLTPISAWIAVTHAVSAGMVNSIFFCWWTRILNIISLLIHLLRHSCGPSSGVYEFHWQAYPFFTCGQCKWIHLPSHGRSL